MRNTKGGRGLSRLHDASALIARANRPKTRSTTYELAAGRSNSPAIDGFFGAPLKPIAFDKEFSAVTDESCTERRIKSAILAFCNTQTPEIARYRVWLVVHV